MYLIIDGYSAPVALSKIPGNAKINKNILQAFRNFKLVFIFGNTIIINRSKHWSN